MLIASGKSQMAGMLLQANHLQLMGMSKGIMAAAISGL
jgi:hypothetical protein